MRVLLAALALMLALADRAAAHSASSAYLQIEAQGNTLAVQWSIAIRDLDYAIGVDADGDGDVTWGELRAQRAAIVAYALPRLRLSADGTDCPAGPVTLLADRLGDGAYAVLRFTAQCARVPHQLGVHYALLFDLDPLHRGLLRAQIGGVVHTEALSPASPDAIIDARADYDATIRTFFLAGMDHLLTGIDHMLFVTMLLVPAVFRRRGGVRLPVQRFSTAFLEAVKLLSVFTLAHGTTLTLSVLHIVSIPPRVSEPAIALTILVTAIDNVFPFLPARRWPLAFAFGLIHGLGFANALGPLTLPPLALATALLSFNLGLDAAQISIAALLLPPSFALRHTAFYARRVLPALSGAVACLALAWFIDRAAAVGVMPF